MEQENKFEAWCVIELFGHQKIAGFVTNENIGSDSFVRVDVPATEDEQAFTRYFGGKAIYAVNPVTEEVARAAAANLRAKPIQYYDIPQLRQNNLALDHSREHQDFDEDKDPEYD